MIRRICKAHTSKLELLHTTIWKSKVQDYLFFFLKKKKKKKSSNTKKCKTLPQFSMWLTMIGRAKIVGPRES